MAKQKSYLRLIFLLIILLACIYFFFGRSYIKQLITVHDFENLNQQALENQNKVSASYATVLSSTDYVSYTSSINSYDSAATLYNQSLLDLLLFTEENNETISSAGLSVDNESALIFEQNQELARLDEAVTAINGTIPSLNDLDLRFQEIAVIDAQIMSYEENETNIDPLMELYTKKLDALYNTNDDLLAFSLQENNADMTNKSYSFLTSSLGNISLADISTWAKTKQKEITQLISATEDKIDTLSSPMYDVDFHVGYLHDVMYGFLNQEHEFQIAPVNFTITNDRNTPLKLKFTASIGEFTTEAQETLAVRARSTDSISLYFQTLPSVDITEKRQAQLKYTVYDLETNELVLEQTKEVSIYPKNVMPWNWNNQSELTVLIAAFVTPHAPVIKELLRNAADFTPDKSMSTFCDWCESSDDWWIAMQRNVDALYSALNYDYDITYVNTPIAFNGTTKETVYQTVYLPSESLTYSSANCIDGTVVFASALEEMGLDSYIVLVPEHAFVCYDMSPQDSYDYPEQCLETTMLGDTRKTVHDAINTGVDEMNTAINYGYFDNGYAALISVKEARDIGILPIE